MNPISDEAIKQLFTEARSYTVWQAQDVSDEMLRDTYDLMKWGPTSANGCPARIIFVRSEAEIERLIPCVAKGNVDQIKTAPVTAIIAQDNEFYNDLPKLFPPFPGMKDIFEKDKTLSDDTAFRNSSLQGAYFIFALRALGLDCCPISGFDNKKLDAVFFAGTSWKSNFICSLGYGNKEKLHPRLPRLSFDEVCKII